MQPFLIALTSMESTTDMPWHCKRLGSFIQGTGAHKETAEFEIRGVPETSCAINLVLPRKMVYPWCFNRFIDGLAIVLLG